MATILIADDNSLLLTILTRAAQEEGYDTLQATDGQAALDVFRASQPQIILLDVLMPRLDGFQVCSAIRKESDVPIIMITACGKDFEKIMGLEIGADDYIVKPCSPAEVMARIKAVLRRVEKSESTAGRVMRIEDLRISLEDYRVSIQGHPIPLTKRETDMLWTLAKGKSRAYTREMLLDLLWGYDYYGDPRTVDSHMKRLRAKLDQVPHPTWEICTIRNVGYQFKQRP